MSEELRERVLDALRGVIDPEVGLSIVDLGLVYGVEIADGRVDVRVTMTTPACPLGDQITRDIEERVGAVAGVAAAHAELVWDPPWSPDRMSVHAKEMLGWNDH